MAMRKKAPMKSYEFVYGMGCNYVDTATNIMYHIQEYKELIEKGAHPKGIRMTRLGNDDTLGYIEDYKLRNLMQDPEPDPRYAPETLEEHRKSF